MYLAIVTLAPHPAGEPRTLDPHLLIDLLWATVSPADGIEHISATTDSHQAHVGLYLHADSQTLADRHAHALMQRATTTQALYGWRVQPRPSGRTVDP